MRGGLENLQVMPDALPEHLSEIVNKLHAIVGDGGRCMCGIYDGKAMGCIDIIGLVSENVRDARYVASLGLTPMKVSEPKPKPMPKGLLRP